MGVILFVTAGTVDYWQAWAYLLVVHLLGRPANDEPNINGSDLARRTAEALV